MSRERQPIHCDRRLLSSYRDGELSSEQKLVVDEHLQACAACTAALRGYIRLAQVIRSMPVQPAPRSITAEVRQGIAEREAARRGRGRSAGWIGAMRPAAAAAAVALTVLIVFRPGALDGPVAPGTVTPESTVQPPIAEAPAAPVIQPPAARPAVPAVQQPTVAQAPATVPIGAGVPRAGLVAQPDGGQRLAGLPSAIGRLYRGNDRIRERLGQAAKGRMIVAVVEGSFQGGLMLWRAYTREMYVFQRKDGTWAVYQSTWRSGDPVALAATPPPGAMAPEGSFGHVWSSHPEVQARLGWAVYEPRGAGGAIQAFENGLVIWSPHGLLYVLGQDGKWKTFADAAPL